MTILWLFSEQFETPSSTETFPSVKSWPGYGVCIEEKDNGDKSPHYRKGVIVRNSVTIDNEHNPSQSYQRSELGLSVFVLIICPLLLSDKGKHSRVTRVNIQMRSDWMTDSLMKLGTQFNFIRGRVLRPSLVLGALDLIWLKERRIFLELQVNCLIFIKL